ncbi:MAG TPA: hypothetical protein VIC26_03055 [Marinagarivorans sp.]
MLSTTETIERGSIAKVLRGLRIKHGHTAKACARTIDSLQNERAIALTNNIASTHEQHLAELDAKLAEYQGDKVAANKTSRALRRFGAPLMLVRGEHSLLDELLTKEQLLALEYEHALSPLLSASGIEALIDTHFREISGACDMLDAYLAD